MAAKDRRRVPHGIKDTPKARRRNTRRPSCGHTKASSVNLPNDPDLILRVRERDPKSLDEALRIAQKLELWKKDSERRLGEGKKSKLTKDDWKMREVTGEEPNWLSL